MSWEGLTGNNRFVLLYSPLMQGVSSYYGHVVHTGLVAVGQLFEADLSLSVHWVPALRLNFTLSICNKLKL